jgi:hypothetical protein
MTYIVQYKLKNQLFFRKIKNIKHDYILKFETYHFPDGVSKIIDSPIRNHRVFIFDDETRLEIPITGTIFKFGKERHYVLEKTMKKEKGQ